MILIAGTAPFQVGLHSGHGRVGIGFTQLELDIAIELCEALLAAQFRPLWSKQAPEGAAVGWILHGPIVISPRSFRLAL